MVASSQSADSRLIPVPLNQILLQRVPCSWSDAQLGCAAILTLKPPLFRVHKQHANVL